MERIAVLTSGGDAPGMNAAIRSVVRTGISKGLGVYGVFHGYTGLLSGEIEFLSSMHVGGIIGHGGTFLRSARSKEFRTAEGRKKAAERLQTMGIEGLIVIGGDGSLTGAEHLSREHGIRVIGIPGSIDNDIAFTDTSIGFDTAVNTALDAIDKLRDTAYSHERVFVIEVMGRSCGNIALECGIAGGAESILIPEIKSDLAKLCEGLQEAKTRGKKSSIIVVAEGAMSANAVAEVVSVSTGFEVRCVVLGHVQRGGSPTAFDRMNATLFGTLAVERLCSEKSGEMVGMLDGKIVYTPLDKVIHGKKEINADKLKLAEVMAQ